MCNQFYIDKVDRLCCDLCPDSQNSSSNADSDGEFGFHNVGTAAVKRALKSLALSTLPALTKFLSSYI
ncbi:Hypothetical protein FKW44_023675, partial [Caligus rogercresseyi]